MWIQDLAQKPMYSVTWAKKNEALAAIIDQNQSVFEAFIAAAQKQVNTLRFIAAILKNLTPLSVINLVSKELATLQEEQNLCPLHSLMPYT